MPRIEFRSIDDDVITERLVQEGVSEEAAADAARSATGDLQRARLLAADPDLVERRRAVRVRSVRDSTATAPP